MTSEDRRTQKKRVYEELFIRAQSMMECALTTGIDRANICWYCRDFRKVKQLYIQSIKVCSITKELVNAYTTNPEFAAVDNQTSLF